MPNSQNSHTITITVDEETHRRACAAAEQHGLSLPELVAQALSASELMPVSPPGAVAGVKTEQDEPEQPAESPDREERRRVITEALEKVRANSPGFSGSDRLSREELYMERFTRRRDRD